MKAYAGTNQDDSSIECSEVDLICNLNELNQLITSLLKFQKEINSYIQHQKENATLGITHMHYRDNTSSWKDDDSDFVIYVNLDE